MVSSTCQQPDQKPKSEIFPKNKPVSNGEIFFSTDHSLHLHSHLTSQTISKWTLLVFLFFLLSLPKHTTPPSPLFFNLTPFPRVYKFLHITCKDFKKRASMVTNVVYTEREVKVTQQRKNVGSDSDEISLLNERIRKDQSKREVSKTVMNSEEVDKYIKLVKEQQQRGLQKLKGDKEGRFSYKVDPYTLQPGDCVVHKKVVVGRFVGIKFDASKDAGQPIEYVFIEYADGMAKLPVKQAARMLYRYNLKLQTRGLYVAMIS